MLLALGIGKAEDAATLTVDVAACLGFPEGVVIYHVI
jgi:hypothetical protein